MYRIACGKLTKIMHTGFFVHEYHYLKEYHRIITFDTTHVESCNILERTNMTYSPNLKQKVINIDRS